jgi:hypothetical protein
VNNIIRNIAVASIVGITSLSLAGSASAKEHTKSTKFDQPAKCVKLSKHGNKMKCAAKAKTVTGKPGANGTNGVNGAQGAPGVNGKDGANGIDGKNGTNGVNAGPGLNGKDGKNGVSGYEVMTWDYDNAGPGAVATVACSDQSKVAVGGGYFIRNANNTDMSTRPNVALENGAGVIASFPGRMDWNTNTPKPNRNDGWIVQFNDKMTGPVTLYVMCVNAA